MCGHRVTGSLHPSTLWTQKSPRTFNYSFNAAKSFLPNDISCHFTLKIAAISSCFSLTLASLPSLFLFCLIDCETFTARLAFVHPAWRTTTSICLGGKVKSTLTERGDAKVGKISPLESESQSTSSEWKLKAQTKADFVGNIKAPAGSSRAVKSWRTIKSFVPCYFRSWKKFSKEVLWLLNNPKCTTERLKIRESPTGTLIHTSQQNQGLSN